MFGFYRIAAATPRVKIGDVKANAAEILRLYAEAARKGAAAVVFPELALTGYSLADLFFNRYYETSVRAALDEIAGKIGDTVLIIGLPWRVESRLFNAAAVIQNRRLRGFALKSVLPNQREFYEKRQFRAANEAPMDHVEFMRAQVPFGGDLLFSDGAGFTFGVEICEDLWSVTPPSSLQALAGAVAVFNLSASNELIGKAEYRRALVTQHSGRTLTAYALAGAGVHESTQETVFGGHSLIAANGKLAAESRRFERKSQLIYADIDLEALEAARMSESSFNDSVPPELRRVMVDKITQANSLEFADIPPSPFVPADERGLAERCSEIFAIQSAALAKRVEKTGAKTLVIGVSGGLDSTLALLVAVESCKLLGMPLSSVIAITMPGFGTTDRTKGNGEKLAEALGVELREIDICAAVKQHLADIGHNGTTPDVTYENAQARERTQILMDIANMHNGIVIGTGDLSEIALGWSTFNGDHMAMYSVNCGVPKTLIRHLIADRAATADADGRQVLQDIIDTPVSPELLPADANGDIAQKTEEIIGPYALHDFFLYHFIKSGAAPDKLKFLANHAFKSIYSKECIAKTLKLFLRRFYTQQFKRNSAPDGPKIGSIALSPRSDWRMPADAELPDLEP